MPSRAPRKVMGSVTTRTEDWVASRSCVAKADFELATVVVASTASKYSKRVERRHVVVEEVAVGLDKAS